MTSRWAGAIRSATGVVTLGSCLPLFADDVRTAGEHLSTAPVQLGFAGILGATADVTQRQTEAQVSLEGSSDEKRGVVAFARQTGTTHLSLKLNAPLDQDAGEAVPVLLDGLSPGATAELSFAQWMWAGPTNAELEAFRGLCQAKLKKRHCRVSDFADGDPDRKQAEGLMHLNAVPWFIGGGVEAGRTEFKYLAPTTLEASSETHTTWTAKGRVGVYTGLGFLVASYGFGKTFEAGSSPRNLCTPLGDAGALTCRNAVIGAPSEATSSTLKVELRRVSASNIAIAPSVERDFKRRVTAVTIPVYFVKDKDGSAIGGLRATWRSDEGGVAVAVFVGSAFKLNP